MNILSKERNEKKVIFRNFLYLLQARIPYFPVIVSSCENPTGQASLFVLAK
jgi:hypothetical protein